MTLDNLYFRNRSTTNYKIAKCHYLIGDMKLRRSFIAMLLGIPSIQSISEDGGSSDSAKDDLVH